MHMFYIYTYIHKYAYISQKLKYNVNVCVNQKKIQAQLYFSQTAGENGKVSGIAKGKEFWTGGYRAAGGSKPWTGMWKWSDGLQIGNDAVLKELIRNGADLNAQNMFGTRGIDHATWVRICY